jgi:rhodanese-related sulfurtransferase
MQHLFEFIGKHWALCAGFVIVLIMVIVEELRSRGKGGGMVSAEAAVQLMNREDAGVLDIRPAAAFRSGHIIGAVNVAKDDLASNLNKIKKFQEKPLIVVCERGNDANRVALSLRRQGFVKPLVLAGGIEAWKSAKYPLSKPAKKGGK